MAVRELLRLDTSAHHQSSLNCVTMSQLPPPAAATEGGGPSESTGGSEAACSSGLDQGSEHEETSMDGEGEC